MFQAEYPQARQFRPGASTQFGGIETPLPPQPTGLENLVFVRADSDKQRTQPVDICNRG